MAHNKSTKSTKWGVLLTTLVASFTVIMNNSLLNVALPYFMNMFNLTAVDAQWIVTIFAMGMLITMTVTPYLGKRFGYRKIYAIGLTFMVIGSILGALAWNFSIIVLARLFQGFGGGFIMPLSMILIHQFFDKNERGFAMGLWGISAMVSPAIGPTIGGIILNYSTWQTMFLVNLPVVLICLITAFYFLRGEKQGNGANYTFDWTGFILISFGSVSLLLAIEQLAHPLYKYLPLVLFIIAAISLALFVYFSLRKQEPLLNIRIVKKRIFTASLLIVASTSMTMFSISLIVPILIQEVMGLSPLVSGMSMFPHAVMIGICMTFGGKLLDKFGPRYSLYTGILVLISAAFFLTFTLKNLSVLGIVLTLMMFGIGSGFLSTPTVTTALNTLNENLVREGAAVIDMVRQFSKICVIVLFSLIYDWRRTFYISQNSELNTAGMLAVKDMFLSMGIVLLILLPVVWYIVSRYERNYRNEEEYRYQRNVR